MVRSFLTPSLFGDRCGFPVTLARRRLLLAVVLLPAVVVISSSARQSKSKVSNNDSLLGANFYKDCEMEIRQALESFSESELAKEAKLTRVGKSNGTSYFYPFQEVFAGKHYFTWTPEKSAKNLTVSSVNSLVISLSHPAKSSSAVGFMSSTFIALRKLDTSSKEQHYYAMVVYARKDVEGTIQLEWDQWSPSLGKALESRKAFEKSIDYMAIITQGAVLCAYGTCSCAACNKCANNKKLEDDGHIDEEALVNDISAEIREYNNMNTRDVGKILPSSKKKSLKKIEKTNAHSSATVTGKHSDANANSFANSNRGTAMAESFSRSHGTSVAVAKGKKNSVTDSKSADGMARALSTANHGFAQSSSQSSFGGGVESIAGKTGEEDEDYDNYDDIEEDNYEEEEFDAEALFKETDQTFEMAEKRTNFTKLIAQGNISGDMCLQELEIIEKIDSMEMAAILESGKRADNSKNSTIRRAFLRKAPLLYGINVDGGARKSIKLAANTYGFTVKQENCCRLKSENGNAAIMQLLDEFGHSCTGSLQDVVSDLEKFNLTQLKKLLQTKKISSIQHHDLIPMLILRNYLLDSEKLQKSIAIINDMFNNIASKKVTLASAIIVNIAHFASVKGIMHKVKIFKGLADNAQSVWTGILLEYKKCIEGGWNSWKNGGKKSVKNSGKGTSAECSERYLDTMDSEMTLALGTYLFLKYADARFSMMEMDDGENPVHTFVDFMQLHNVNILRQVYCKTKRLAILSQY